VAAGIAAATITATAPVETAAAGEP
jgi:hypothetical protein